MSKPIFPQTLLDKIKTLPNKPGVYFHKNIGNEIIYVGKAAILKNRVRHYFQNTEKDAKTTALIAEIYDTDWRVVESEIDALFLESEMIKRYQPKWNILLRDDKTVSYVRVNLKSSIPTVRMTRTPIDDGATYVGPFYGQYAIKKALRTLRKAFPFLESENPTSKLYTHLNLSPDLGEDLTRPDPEKLKSYRKNLKKLILYLENGRFTLMKQIEKEMLELSRKQDFEGAAKLRNQLYSLKELERKIIFSDEESIELSKDQALQELSELLSLNNLPKRIEGYDISHHAGKDAVASMVVFTNGLSDRAEYRKFKIKCSKNNDFENLKETLMRRMKHSEWQKPDLLLIDGGIPQLRYLNELLTEVNIPYLGLSEKFEHVIVPTRREGDLKIPGYQEVILSKDSHLLKLLQRIRDEAHRFAITYHTYLKRKNMLK